MKYISTVYFTSVCMQFKYNLTSPSGDFTFFKKVDTMGLYLLQHMFYIVHTDTFSAEFTKRSLIFWMFFYGDVNHGRLLRMELKLV